MQKLQKIEPLSEVPATTEEPFSSQQIKNIQYLIDKLNYSTEDAIELIKSDDSWNKFLEESLKGSKLKNIDLIDKVRAKVAEKAEAGFMESAQKGGVLLAILTDKTYGPTSETNKPMFNVNGKNVGIKVNFAFRPQGKAEKHD